jgi:diacylglycerol kinase family enzyme
VRADRALVVFNEGAGAGQAAATRPAVERALTDLGCTMEVFEATPGDDLPMRIGQALDRALASGCELVLSVGGDGTLQLVGDQLARLSEERPATLAIVPMGTGNVFAGQLGIPTEAEAALRVLTNGARERTLSAMRIGERHFFTHVDVGLGGAAIRDTSVEEKQRFGRLAYLAAFARVAAHYDEHAFHVTIDGGQPFRTRAWQVSMMNVGAPVVHPAMWSGGITAADDVLDVYVFNTRLLPAYLRRGLARMVGLASRYDRLHMHARNRVRVETRTPLPVQADGEHLGETPVEVTFVPRALRVLVPGEPGL